MKKNVEKPTTEAKALSLFLMAFKTTDPIYKEKSKRMNKLWDQVAEDKLSKSDYLKEVNNTLKLYGGYPVVVEKTVRHYIEKTGEWKSRGNDQYSKYAQKIADKILKE